MPIERKLKNFIPKRQVDEIQEKNRKVGELLNLKKVPLHILAWKEPRLELGDGDCYPLVDVILKIAELLEVPAPEAEEKFICGCGFEAKTKAGLVSHRRNCDFKV